MSKQKFSSIEREAFIKVYGTCVYTDKNLNEDNMQLDHIIPESLKDKVNELESLLSKVGLPADFDVNSYDNIIPVTAKANYKKGDKILVENSIPFFVSIARSKKDRLNIEIEKIKRYISNGNLSLKIKQLSYLSAESIKNIIKLIEDKYEIKIDRVKIRNLNDFIDCDFIDKNFIDAIRDQELTVACNLINDMGDMVEVRSCIDYRNYINNGYRENCNIDLKSAIILKQMNIMLDLILEIKLPEKNHLNGLGLYNIERLSSRILPDICGESEDENDNTNVEVSYKQLLDSSKIVIKNVSSDLLHIESFSDENMSDGLGQVLYEIARGDFSGNGNEEILVFERIYATQGTLGMGSVKLLYKEDDDLYFRSKDYIDCVD